MTERVLCVDDEPHVLQAIKRHLHKQFEVDTAEGGDEGLVLVRTRGPYAVVVSDMRMPGMTGNQFLAKVRDISPDTIRIMLTGFADLSAAVDAINEGQIFRFLNKPCPSDVLAATIASGIEQFRLVNSERELLSKTLTGSVKALIDILSLNNPVAFGRASRVRRIVAELADRLDAPGRWELEISALLAQIGLVAVPESIWAKVRKSEWLSPQELSVLQSYPQVARDLLANIPRLAPVAEIVAYQNKHFDGRGSPADGLRGEEIPLGARILKVAMDFESLVTSSGRPDLVFQEIRARAGQYDPQVVAALDQLAESTSELVVSVQPLDAIPDNMAFAKDVTAVDGEVVVSAGAEMSPALRMKLKAHIETGQITDSFEVQAIIRKTPAEPAPTQPKTRPVDLLA